MYGITVDCKESCESILESVVRAIHKHCAVGLDPLVFGSIAIDYQILLVKRYRRSL